MFTRAHLLTATVVIIAASMDGLSTAGESRRLQDLPGVVTPTSAGAAVGEIRGRVVSGDTGRPLPYALITTTGPDAQRAITDDNGYYRLGPVPEGRVSLIASKSGYASIRYGQEWPSQGGTSLIIAPGKTLADIDFALPKGGVIVAYVSDEFGEPLSLARVQSFRYEYGTDGRRKLVRADALSAYLTDDRGLVRLANLRPGEYIVNASVLLSDMFDSNGTHTGFPLTYFPDAATPNVAQLVSVGASSEVPISIVLRRVPLSRVTGHIVRSDGRAAANANVQLYAGEMSRVAGAVARQDGFFDIPRVPVGEYVLEVHSSVEQKNAHAEFAMTTVLVSNSQTDLQIATSRGAALSGALVVDDIPATMRKSPVQITLDRLDEFGGRAPRRAPTAVSIDGVENKFDIDGAFGRVMFKVAAPLNNVAIKSVFLDGRDVTLLPLDVKGHTKIQGINVVVSRAATIVGEVAAQAGERLHDYCVVVIPADDVEPEVAARLTRLAFPTTVGVFQVPGLSPGRYVAIALSGIEPGTQFAPAFHDQVRLRGATFTLAAGEVRQIRLQLARPF